VVERCHLRVLQTLKDIDLVALVDPDRDRVNRVADRLHVHRRYSDYRAMLDDAPVDVVAVCAPPQYHAEVGLAVLDAGRHLFMEKPLALSLDDADRLVDRAAASTAKALVGFNLRWHRLVREAQRIIADDGLGTLETMHTMFTSRTAFARQGSEWRCRHDLGGSVLLDLGIHHFDLWRLLMQSEVDEVVAYRSAHDAGVECGTVSAVMANGALVTSSFSHGVTDANEVEICGRNGRLRFSCYRSGSFRVHENSAPQGGVRTRLSEVIGAVKNAPYAASQWYRGGDMIASYRGEWQHFIDAIRNDTPIQGSLEAGRSALQVALAAVESAACGQPLRVARAPRALTPMGTAARAGRSVG
jgi:myo-inositol 2-dehydrogenase/D-chiro-inositol 1-dehydrogenase